MASTVFSLQNTSKAEISEAAGNDRVGLVRGNRRAASRFLQNEDNTHDSQITGKNPRSKSHDRISSGRGINHSPSLTASHHSIAIQTDNEGTVFGEVTEKFLEKNVGILIGRPRDIQLTNQLTLEEAMVVGIKVKASQTQVTSPNLLSFTAAMAAVVTKSVNKIPHVVLYDWHGDIQREIMENERDSEWLEQVGSWTEDSKDDMQNAQDEIFKKQSGTADVNPYCSDLMHSIRLLLGVMKYGGRWPYTTTIDQKRQKFKIKKCSLSYVIFVMTSFLHLVMSGLAIFNTWDFARAKQRTAADSFYIQVTNLEFDKYWEFAFWTYLMAVFVIIWNFSLIIEDGFFIGELMNRWNYAVTQLHYTPTLRIHRRICTWTIGFFIYAVIVTILCFTELSPITEGSAGVLGVFFIKNANPRIRFSRYFWVARLFGLSYHLYTFYAAGSAMLFVVTYVKLLENAARHWNLRFALKFEMLGTGDDGGNSKKTIVYKTRIPLWKLLNEHRIITAFSRHTADVFTLIVNTYILTKGLEVMLLLYRSFTYFLIPDIKFKSTFIPYPIGESGDKIRYRDSNAHRVMSCLLITIFVVGDWFITLVSITACGEAILSGFSFVRRHGLILCKDAQERLFIQSLQFQYSPVLEYFFKQGFVVNRLSTFEMFKWILIFALGLLSFNPFLLQKNEITFCKPPSPKGEINCKTVLMSGKQIGAGRPPAEVLRQATVSSSIRNVQCEGTTAFDENGNEIAIHVINSIACDEAGFEIRPFTPFQVARCFNEFDDFLRITPNKENSHPYPGNQNLTHCDTRKQINQNNRDNCGNLQFEEETTMKPVKLNFKDPRNGKLSARYVCCYDYGDKESLHYCHMQSPTQSFYACFDKAKDKRPICSATTKNLKSTTTTAPPSTTTTTMPLSTPTTTRPTTTTTTIRPTSTTTTTRQTTTTTTRPTTTTTTTRPTTTTTTTRPTTTTTRPTTTTTTTRPTTTTTTLRTTITTSTMPTPLVTTPETICKTTWNGESTEGKVLTNVYKVCTSKGKIVLPYAGGKSYCAQQSDGAAYVNAEEKVLRDCTPQKRQYSLDECGNIDTGYSRKKVVLKLVLDDSIMLLCVNCVNYAKEPKNSESLKYCHMQSTQQALKACIKKGVRVRIDQTDVAKIQCDAKPVPPNKATTCKTEQKWHALNNKNKNMDSKVISLHACHINDTSAPKYKSKTGSYGTCFQSLHSEDSELKSMMPYDYLDKNSQLRSCAASTQSRITTMIRDDCGNLPHADTLRMKQIDLHFSGKYDLRKEKFSITVCCYDYANIPVNRESVKLCHMESEEMAFANCKQLNKYYNKPKIFVNLCQ